MLHTSTLPRRLPGRDISVPLSRTRIPRFVLQDRLCSVHAEGAFSGRRRQLCAVNLKLTMQLGIGASLLVSAHFSSRRFSPGAGETLTQGEVRQFGHRAGRGGDVARALREKIGTNEGGLSQSPPFSLGLLSRTRCSALALLRRAETRKSDYKMPTPRLRANSGAAPNLH